MITQQEFVADCYLDYAIQGLEPGNPEHGTWNKCHYPVPRCLGGTEWIWLLEQHHAVQGLLQSNEYSHPCIYGWEKTHLPESLHSLYNEWMTKKSQYSASCGHTEYGNTKRAEWNRANIPQRITGTKWWTDGTNNVRQVECPGPGWINGRSPESVNQVTTGLRKWMKDNPAAVREKAIKGGKAGKGKSKSRRRVSAD